jgi:hypothetical protein
MARRVCTAQQVQVWGSGRGEPEIDETCRRRLHFKIGSKMPGAGDSYMEDLQGWVCDEMKPVNFHWLSNELSVPSNSAKQYVGPLFKHCSRHN